MLFLGGVMKECPNCKCVHESNIQHCRCGYDLTLNTLNNTKFKYAKSLLMLFAIIFVNAFLSVLGAYASFLILIGYLGFMFDRPTITSKVISSFAIIIFLAILVFCNYFIIKRVLEKRVYFVLAGLATFLLGFIIIAYKIYIR